MSFFAFNIEARIYFFVSLILIIFLFGLNQAIAADAFELYGRANVSTQTSKQSSIDFKSNASRLGVKGKVNLADELTLLYTWEWDVDLASSSKRRTFRKREQYIGVKSKLGTVLLGRNNTTLKLQTRQLDVFNDYLGDVKGLWQGENRLAESLTYYSPSYANFTIEFNYTQNAKRDSLNKQNGTSVGLIYGDKTLSHSDWFVGIAVESKIRGVEVERLVYRTKFGSWLIGGALHHQQTVNDNQSQYGGLVSAQYVKNNWRVNAQVQTLSSDHSVSFGGEYVFSQNTKAYAFYTDSDLTDRAEKEGFGVGVEHKF